MDKYNEFKNSIPGFDLESHLKDMIESKPVFKIVLVGNTGVGKTTYVHRLKDLDFDPRYNGTIGVEVHPHVLYTNRGPIVFNIWDTSGQEKFGDLRDGYYTGMDAAIVMGSYSSQLSMHNYPLWHKALKKVSDVPTIFVMNKSDVADKVSPDYISISAKNKSGLLDPLLHLTRVLLKDENIHPL